MNDEDIISMCKNLNCVIESDNCVYSFNRFIHGLDCDGPYLKEDFVKVMKEHNQK